MHSRELENSRAVGRLGELVRNDYEIGVNRPRMLADRGVG